MAAIKKRNMLVAAANNNNINNSKCNIVKAKTRAT